MKEIFLAKLIKTQIKFELTLFSDNLDDIEYKHDLNEIIAFLDYIDCLLNKYGIGYNFKTLFPKIVKYNWNIFSDNVNDEQYNDKYYNQIMDFLGYLMRLSMELRTHVSPKEEAFNKLTKAVYSSMNRYNNSKNILPSDNVDDEQYNNYFNQIIDIVDTHTIYSYKLDYSKIKAHNKSKRNITWDYVQSTDNAFDKYTFAKKVYDRCLVTIKNSYDIIQLIALNHYLGLLTNVKNFYFNLSLSEAIQKSFDNRYKRSKTIFREETKALAMDYRKFYDINRFSEKSMINVDESIRINQEQGFELVKIGNLICKFNLNEAYDKIWDIKSIYLPRLM